MSINIHITDSVNAREIDSGIVLNWTQGLPITLEILIRERVRSEIENEFNSKGLPDFHPLVERKKSPGFETQQETRITNAVETALNGFQKNAFFIFVDGQQVETLNEEFQISPTSTVRFVRLIPLKGG